jgi:hypothetical protein
MSCPRIDEGWPWEMARRALLSIASTKPSPRNADRVPQGAHVVAGLHDLLEGRVDRAVVDERAARVIDENASLCVEASGAQLGDLAGAAGHRRLVALDAGLGIEHRPRPSTPLSNSRSSKASSAASNSVAERNHCSWPS